MKPGETALHTACMRASHLSQGVAFEILTETPADLLDVQAPGTKAMPPLVILACYVLGGHGQWPIMLDLEGAPQ